MNIDAVRIEANKSVQAMNKIAEGLSDNKEKYNFYLHLVTLISVESTGAVAGRLERAIQNTACGAQGGAERIVVAEALSSSELVQYFTRRARQYKPYEDIF